MLRLAGVLLLACFTSGSLVVNINDLTDEALNHQNEVLTKLNFGLTPAIPLTLPNFTFSNGVSIGLNSQHRTGDCSLTVSPDNKTFGIDLHFGQRLAVLAYGSMKAHGYDFSGVMRIRNNSIHFSYNVTLTPACKVTLGVAEVEALDNVTLEHSVTNDVIDVSEYFEDTARPIINNILSKLKGKIEYALNLVICNKNTAITDHLPHFFATLTKMNLFQQAIIGIL